MKTILFFVFTLISLSTIASYDAEIFIFSKTVVLPGDCKYLVKREEYVCRKESDLVIVSFPSMESVIQNYHDFTSSSGGSTEQIELKFSEKTSYGPYDHFATAFGSQGVTVLQYSICNVKECISVISGNPHILRKLLNQFVSELILVPEDLNDL